MQKKEKMSKQVERPVLTQLSDADSPEDYERADNEYACAMEIYVVLLEKRNIKLRGELVATEHTLDLILNGKQSIENIRALSTARMKAIDTALN